MKITHFEVGPDDHSMRMSTGHTVDCIAEPLSADNVAQAANSDCITVFVNSMIDKKIIDALPNTKLIVTRSTGFDHIDTEYAKSKGMTICYIPAYGSRTVAEFTFALILNLSRRTYPAINQIKQSNDWDISHFEGFNLQGKTLGVVGTGRIGQNVIQIAKGFDMNIIAQDAFPNEDKAKELGFKYVSLDELLGASDVITFHVPATPETHHLLNKNNIKNVKKGAVIVNTSRGDVIDPEALVWALKQDLLDGVGLDVLEGEHEIKEESELTMTGNEAIPKLKALLEDHMLINFDNVIVTPHIGFNTKEARQEITNVTMENIRLFEAGTPQNMVK